jgi:hypothetical protein
MHLRCAFRLAFISVALVGCVSPVELASGELGATGACRMKVTVEKPTRIGIRLDIHAQEERQRDGFFAEVSKTQLRVSAKDATGKATSTSCKMTNGTSHGPSEKMKKWPRIIDSECDCKLLLEPGTSDVIVEVAWTDKGPAPKVAARAIVAR